MSVALPEPLLAEPDEHGRVALRSQLPLFVSKRNEAFSSLLSIIVRKSHLPLFLDSPFDRVFRDVVVQGDLRQRALYRAQGIELFPVDLQWFGSALGHIPLLSGLAPISSHTSILPLGSPLCAFALSPSTVNCGLRTLRRALSLAYPWGKLDRMPKITLAKGEAGPERLLVGAGGAWSEEWIMGDANRSKGAFEEEFVWERDPKCAICGDGTESRRYSPTKLESLPNTSSSAPPC